MTIQVALIGNPNVGKSVVFNNLTGLKQHTGNWPGKTVERKEGYYDYKGRKFEVVDLPGVYSLNAMSEDEEVARHWLIDHRPDVVVDVLNASQLERNLYLTLLLIEMQVNLVVVLNMYDIVEQRGDSIDVEQLSQLLKAPVVVTTATKKEGMDELRKAIYKAIPEDMHKKSEDGRGYVADHVAGDIDNGSPLHYHPKHHHHGEYEPLPPPAIKYSPLIEKKLEQIIEILKKDKELFDRFPPRWLALKLFEQDNKILSMIEDKEIRNRILEVTS